VNVFLKNLQRQAQENPSAALAAGAAVLAAVGKLIGVGVDAKNSHAWKKEVDRRRRKDGLK